MVEFEGVEYDRVPSNISGKDWVIYHADKKKTYQMPYYNKVLPTDSALVPFAYLIPVEWKEEIQRIKLHGIKINYLSKDTSLAVSSYRFSNIKWPGKSYEGHQQPEYDITPVEEISQGYPGGFAGSANKPDHRQSAGAQSSGFFCFLGILEWDF